MTKLISELRWPRRTTEWVAQTVRPEDLNLDLIRIWFRSDVKDKALKRDLAGYLRPQVASAAAGNVVTVKSKSFKTPKTFDVIRVMQMPFYIHRLHPPLTSIVYIQCTSGCQDKPRRSLVNSNEPSRLARKSQQKELKKTNKRIGSAGQIKEKR